MTLFISERERDENGTESKETWRMHETHGSTNPINSWNLRGQNYHGSHDVGNTGPIQESHEKLQPMICREVFASWLPSWLDPWLMAGPTWRNMQSAASHPSASDKSGSEEEAERSLFLHCFFFGTCWPFWKGMGCNGKESLVHSEFIIISNTYIHIMYIQYVLYPRHTVKFSAGDWDLQSPPQHGI